jgi:arginyl-tRNA synthetase
VLTAELRRAILAAAGAHRADPLLRPGPVPGSYASSLPFRLAPANPREPAAALASRLQQEPWIASAQVTGPGYLTVTVTHEALATLAVRITQAGPACATSDALSGENIRAAQPTARLAVAAGATVFFYAERAVVSPPVARAIAFAGQDAVRFALARTPPGGPVPDAAVVARHTLANPAYAVRYAHAAAVAVLRWASAIGITSAGFRPRLLTAPGELALLDALSWLPERVAAAARRRRPDEFARYLEALAARTIDTMSTTGFRTISSISSERLWLADAARTGLAAGLGLLGVGAPDRL